ncbi:MAG: LysE family translocator [Alphaproteobacteria bacterium]|nr:LysE family translocator [Alphaproteobacteria bacterium]MBU1513222.1 LysE family translocator [Alphaproteobacteria bacterium]MBU2095330.1 LysE family translocator [Alphaproteobacteria bacterium]MBU2152245.1 LysE family translocator [Alphaproteobacteria bacterium]MBU2306708.1 LysE family translocator [Alphaproteobacteria bacterium]
MSEHILSLVALFGLCLATSIIPGPSNFLTMRVAMRRGRRPALAAALGTTLGCVIWCAAAAVGLAALLAAAPWLYKILRVGGGLYLIWFSISLWRAKPELEQAEPPPGAAKAAFLQGLGICLTNPKSVLFFASVFSAYVGPDSPGWVHWAAVVVVTITCLLWQAGLALAFSALRAAQAYARAQKPLDRGAAGLMGAFGLSLLWTAG